MTAASVEAPAKHVAGAATEAARHGLDVKVLVVGNYRPTIATVRSLGKAGCRLVVGCPPLRWYAEKSRYVGEAWIHPPLEDSEFGLALLDFSPVGPTSTLSFPSAGTQSCGYVRSTTDCRGLSQW